MMLTVAYFLVQVASVLLGLSAYHAVRRLEQRARVRQMVEAIADANRR